jgi:hypothetical protein
MGMHKGIYESALIPVTIHSGTSDSDPLTFDNRTLQGFFLPVIDNAAISFRMSFDGSTFFPVFATNGVEITVTASVGSRFITISTLGILGGSGSQFMKFRSGTDGAPVNQTADRIINAVLLG